jgi:adenylate cyclase
MDGLSLLQKLQESEQGVSTIIVSAYGDMVNIRTAMNRGAFDFVTKPIDFPDLEATIAKTLRHIEFLRNARECQAAAERAYASLSRYFSPNLAQCLATDADASILLGNAARSQRCSQTSTVSRHLSRHWIRASSDHCSMSILPA